jgi:hypothetical protein
MQAFLESSELLLRPAASWRRMLVQQPPIMVLAGLERSVAPLDMTSLHRWGVPLHAFGGLRMNMLYELVVQTAEIAPQYFYFRVCWSLYETYEFRHRLLKPDPDPLSSIDGNFAGPYKNALDGADFVLDIWFAERLRWHLLSEWEKDTWTWDLVKGLQAPMGGSDAGLVHDMEELKEADSWSLSPLELPLAEDVLRSLERMFIPEPTDMLLPDEDDPDI